MPTNKRNRRSFAGNNLTRLHPVSLLILFASVIIISMFSGNPIILGILVTQSLLTNYILKGSREFFRHLRLMLVLAFLTAILNPLFNHRGRTVLTTLPGGNVMTLEAVFYGLYAALILISVLSWFSCFNAVFDTDKLLYIFGGLSPALSMVLSMALHFIPEFIARAREIRQINTGLYGRQQGLMRKIRQGMRNFGSLLTWALESSVKKARAMRDRAYGSGKRSRYSIFRFTGRDLLLIILTLGFDIIYIALHLSHAFDFWFYPLIYGDVTAPAALAGYLLILLLGLLPVTFEYRHMGTILKIQPVKKET